MPPSKLSRGARLVIWRVFTAHDRLQKRVKGRTKLTINDLPGALYLIEQAEFERFKKDYPAAGAHSLAQQLIWAVEAAQSQPGKPRFEAFDDYARPTVSLNRLLAKNNLPLIKLNGIDLDQRHVMRVLASRCGKDVVLVT